MFPIRKLINIFLETSFKEKLIWVIERQNKLPAATRVDDD